MFVNYIYLNTYLFVVLIQILLFLFVIFGGYLIINLIHLNYFYKLVTYRLGRP